jgi:type II secretory pathway pseudopilin PulG
MSRLRDESGWSLMELLVAMTMMLVVLFATLTTFEQFTSTSALSSVRSEARDRVRVATDRMTREMRNLASPTNSQLQPVDKATAYDVVFQTVDPNGPNGGTNLSNVRRVRYCLNATAPSNEKLWRQIQTWTGSTVPAVPSTTACPDPDTNWTQSSNELIADRLVNQINSQTRPLWLFDSSIPAGVTTIRTNAFIDINPGSTPGESQLQTGVVLRNQNRAPVASFTASAVGNRHVLLNGSTSYDPAGHALTYVWYDGATKVGNGVTLDYLAPSTGSHTLTLNVFNPANLQGSATPQAVNVI